MFCGAGCGHAGHLRTEYPARKQNVDVARLIEKPSMSGLSEMAGLKPCATEIADYRNRSPAKAEHYRDCRRVTAMFCGAGCGHAGHLR